MNRTRIRWKSAFDASIVRAYAGLVHLPPPYPARTLLLRAVTALLPLVAGACTSPPEQAAPSPSYAVVATLAEPHESTPLSVLSSDGEVVGREFRPTVEGSWARPVVPLRPPSVVDGVLQRSYRVGPFLGDKTVLVSRTFTKKGQGAAPQRLPSVLVKAQGQTIVVPFEVPDFDGNVAGVELFAVAMILPPAQRALTMKPVTVAPGAVLAGGFGLSSLSVGASASPVHLSVVARTDAGDRVLLQKSLAQNDDRSFTWSDYRIDLGELAGQTVRFELRSAVEPRKGEHAAVAYPEWSVPTLLAPRASEDTRNVVLFSLDTLRADFVGAYGQELPTTPNIDRFAAEGMLFENTYTTYPSTTASHMSMLTGLYPSVHGVYAHGAVLSTSHDLLASAFAQRGYQTAAVTEDGMLTSSGGFTRDFRSYREYLAPDLDAYGSVAEVVDSAVDWLRRHRDERFFLFLHTYQVHSPYSPPKGYDVFTSYREDGREVVLGPDAPEHVRARLGYAGDLLYTDEHVGRLLGEIEALGRRDDTVVVITADHGEALGEHGAIGHGWYLYEPVLRVPLLIRAPGRVPAGLRITSRASLVDVTPTILELAGVSPTAAMQGQMQGASLVPLIDDPDDARFRDRVIYVEKQRADGTLDVTARQGPWKWMTTKGRVTKRYDLEDDPREKHAAEDPEALAAGQQLVDRYRAANDQARSRLGDARPSTVKTDEETMNKLRALGYVD